MSERFAGLGRRSASVRGGKAKAEDAEPRNTVDGADSTQKADGDAYAAYTGWRSLINPIWCYYGFMLIVAALTVFGLVMVFSSSSVRMISVGASPWKQALNQLVFCVLGVVLAVVAARIKARNYRRRGMLFVMFAIGLQLLTMSPLGVSRNGNTGWIALGPLTLQPAEVMKLALCMWLPAAMRDSNRRSKKLGIRAYLLPVVVFVICLGAVMMGKDLGTAMILIFIGAVAFLIGGFPGKWLAGASLVIIVLVAAFVLNSPNRKQRILAAYQDCNSDSALDVCYQSVHSKYAMASGGLFGVGIGNSREKWNYLPEAHNDFIFAIIGEETGFIGAAIVVLLFVALAWCMFVLALQSSNRYTAMVLICEAVWIVGQAMVNIMVVVGLLPVMGVPLPFVSAGGSSLVMCLIAAGVAVSMMREQKQVKANVAARSV